MNNSLSIQGGRAFRPAFFVIALCLAISCSRADLPDNDYAKYWVNVPVKGFHVYQADSCYRAAGSNVSVTFNEDGFVSQVQHFFPDGTAGGMEAYQYDDKGRLSEINLFDMDGGESGWYEYEYDGRIIKTCTIFGKNNQVIFKWEHENDGVRIIKTSLYNEAVLDNVSESVFSGNVRSETVRNPQGEEFLHNTYEYYDLTNQLISSFKNEDTSFRIEYNDKGLPCRSVAVLVDASGGLYVDDSRPEAEILYEYDFDDRGNWTTRRQLFDGKVIETLKRTIEY